MKRLSVIEQTAQHLREAILAGHWREGLPGVRRLAAELRISHDSARAALRMLEAEGALATSAKGSRRQVAGDYTLARRGLRVGVLLQTPLELQNTEMQRTLLGLQHDVEAAGHIWVLAGKCHDELRAEPERLGRVVESARADVWIVVLASSPILAWFSRQPLPVVAFGSASMDYPVPTVALDLSTGIREVTRHLLALGHRRIVLIATSALWHPTPSRPVLAFREELAGAGVPVSDYHTPTWEQSAKGLRQVLESLFHVTPPTALVVLEPPRLLGLLQFLNHRQLRMPEDVSLVCLGQDSMFDWCEPPIAHLRYDLRKPARRIFKWIEAVAHGRHDKESVLFAIDFEPGSSTGPVRKKG